VRTASWSKSQPSRKSGINDDGVTNVLDLIDVLLAFGAACP